MLTGSLASGSLSYHNNVSLIQITAGSIRYGSLACQRATKTHILHAINHVCKPQSTVQSVLLTCWSSSVVIPHCRAIDQSEGAARLHSGLAKIFFSILNSRLKRRRDCKKKKKNRVEIDGAVVVFYELACVGVHSCPVCSASGTVQLQGG